jgi:pyruvate carboxylase
LKYYVNIAKQMQKAGIHMLGLKDMAGICKPRAVKELVRVLKEETGLPIHFHTHDTSGIASASVMAAIDAGCNAVDAAFDSMSGLTSQPSLNSIVAALAGSDKDTGLSEENLRLISHYWEDVRKLYTPFESDIRSGTSDVYQHEMPGGQYTNLREQARAMGLAHRWPEVSKAYAQVNQLFGDIVKVTPTSKVVGDMAIVMVASDLSPQDVADPKREVTFPESVVSLFKGELGFGVNDEGVAENFPEGLSQKILKSPAVQPFRPGDRMPMVDLQSARLTASQAVGHALSDTELASYLMYPKVFTDFAKKATEFSDLAVLPTSAFFYGMREREEIAIDIDAGKTLLVRLQGTAPSDEEGLMKVFFELNGQPRTLRVEKRALDRRLGSEGGPIAVGAKRPVAEVGNMKHVPSPMPGMVVTVAVKVGQHVIAGDALFSIEAMKMESQIRAEREGTVKAIYAKAGDTVNARELIIEFNT